MYSVYFYAFNTIMWLLWSLYLKRIYVHASLVKTGNSISINDIYVPGDNNYNVLYLFCIYIHVLENINCIYMLCLYTYHASQLQVHILLGELSSFEMNYLQDTSDYSFMILFMFIDILTSCLIHVNCPFYLYTYKMPNVHKTASIC